MYLMFCPSSLKKFLFPSWLRKHLTILDPSLLPHAQTYCHVVPGECIFSSATSLSLITKPVSMVGFLKRPIFWDIHFEGLADEFLSYGWKTYTIWFLYFFNFPNSEDHTFSNIKWTIFVLHHEMFQRGIMTVFHIFRP